MGQGFAVQDFSSCQPILFLMIDNKPKAKWKFVPTTSGISRETSIGFGQQGND
jgi:hypothetical protein